jgi:hypothetical protein
MAANEAPDTRRTYRNILLVLVRGGAAALAGVLFMVIASVALIFAPEGAIPRLGFAAVMALLGAILILLAVRIIGSRMTTVPDGVFVHTVFRRCVFVPWAEVTDVRLIPAPRLRNQFARDQVAVAIFRGHRRRLLCLGASFEEPSPAADTMLRSLRAEYTAWRDTSRDEATTGAWERATRRGPAA